MTPDFQAGLTWRMLLIEKLKLGKWRQRWYKEDRCYFKVAMPCMQLVTGLELKREIKAGYMSLTV